ncbi:unnamed protein product [Withania somnifera]
MDQVMRHDLVNVRQINTFRNPYGRGMRAVRIINWIVLLLISISVAFLFYWFFTSGKFMKSGNGRVTAFIDYSWIENNLIVKQTPLMNNTGSGAANEQSNLFNYNEY